MERAPNAWDRFYHAQVAPWRGERPVEALLPLLGDGAVLELGCGNGKLLKPLQQRGIQAIGLDISFNILARLGEGVLADASVLPFADGAFSAVLDVHCTGHLLTDGRAAAAAEKHRVLRPGGHLIVERLAPEDLRAMQGEPVEDGTCVLKDGRTTHFCDAEAIMREHPGFTMVSEEVESRTPRYAGARVTRASVRVVLRRD